MLVSLGNYCVQHTFLVVHGLTVEGLLGADFLAKHKAVVDFVHHRLILGSNGDNIPVQDPGQEAKCSQSQWTPLQRCQAGQFY